MSTPTNSVPHGARADAEARSGRMLLALLVALALLPLLLALPDHGDREGVVSLTGGIAADGEVERAADGRVQLTLENRDKWGEFRIALPQIPRGDGLLQLVYVDSGNVAGLQLVQPDCVRCSASRHPQSLIDNDHGQFRFAVAAGATPEVTVRVRAARSKRSIRLTLSAVELLPRSLPDSRAYFVLLGVSTAALLALAGLLAAAVAGTALRLSPQQAPLLVLPGALLVALFPAAALLLWQRLVPENFVIATALSAAAVGFALALSAIRLRAGAARLLWLSRFHFLAYLLVVLASAVLLSLAADVPLQEHGWMTVARDYMFNGHTAHDNLFQYLNGIAIAEDRPFNYYYHAPQLVRMLFYGVEDRQMLAGLLFGGYRVLWSAVSPYVAGGYGLFTLFGLALTALLVVPVCWLFTRLFGGAVAAAGLAAFCLNPYVLGNLYYTWFKILGGGLILVAVALLYYHGRHLRSWIVAGIALGLAANLHAGLTMTYPVLALYFIARGIRGGGWWPRVLLSALLMTAVTVAALMPWEWVKRQYFFDDKELLRSHLLAGQAFDTDLATTAANFLADNPPREQLAKRLGNLVGAARLDELGALVSSFREQGAEAALLLWNRLQFRYFAIMFYPLLALLAVAMALRRCGGSAAAPPREGRSDAHQLAGLAALSILWGLLVMMTGKEADSSSFVAPFGLVYLNMYLPCLLFSQGRPGQWLGAGWLLLGAVKIAVAFAPMLAA